MLDIFQKVVELYTNKRNGVLLNVVKKTGSGPAEVGAKMLIDSNQNIFGSIGGGSLEYLAVEKAKEILKTEKNDLVRFSLEESTGKGEQTDMVCGGTATVYFEYINPNPHIFIFGAGHICQALLHHLKRLNYSTVVIDNRKEIISEIEDADKIIHSDFDKVFERLETPDNSYFLVATYEHKHDSIVLKNIFNADCETHYIGMVSSSYKRQIIFDDLKKNVKNANTDICYIPVGLDTGGSTPDEIAISIIAEIQKIRYKTTGKHLRDIK